MRKIFLLLLPLLLFFGIFPYFSDDFYTNAIPSGAVDELFWEAPPTNEQVNAILKQKFFYLDEGGQSYAFVNEEGTHVLKLFKFNRLTPKWIIEALPDWNYIRDLKKNHTEKRRKKLTAAFQGHRIAYEELKEESRLVYMQMKPAKVARYATLVDAKGVHHTVDLGKVIFVLQEKGEMLSTAFTRELEKGNTELIARQIEQVFELYRSEYRKGIVDTDHGVIHNIGIAADRPFHLDVGKLTKDPKISDPAFQEKDLAIVERKIFEWLDANFPHHAEKIKQQKAWLHRSNQKN